MRNVRDVTIPPGVGQDRDAGKVFRITEMSAYHAERWATRATLTLAPKLSAQIPEDVAHRLTDGPSMMKVEQLFGLLGQIATADMQPLLDELMTCVQYLPDPRGHPLPLDLGGSETIEEMETYRLLRREVMALHTGFTFAASILGWVEAVSAVTSETTETSQPQ